jgi:predicted NodU family carbamoyl transferase
MGLAPYGRPIYKDAILENVMDLKEDGSFRMDMSYFNYCQGLTMTSGKLHKLLGGPCYPKTHRNLKVGDVIDFTRTVCHESHPSTRNQKEEIRCAPIHARLQNDARTTVED